MYTQLKKDILGKDYDLSIAFVDEKKSKELNKKWRGINKATNILSFALSKNKGEIVLCKAVIKRDAQKFSKTFRQFLGFLVIHGMLHLKGMEHSSTMEEAEAKYDQKYFYRNRRGILHHTSSGGRISKRRKKS